MMLNDHSLLCETMIAMYELKFQSLKFQVNSYLSIYLSIYIYIYMGFARIHPLVFIKVCLSKDITKKLLNTP